MAPIRWLLVAATTLCVVSTAVQAASIPIAGYGFRGGVAASTIGGKSNDAFRSETRAGFASGAFCRIPVGRILSIQPELGWASKGDRSDFTVRYTSPGGTTVTTLTSDLDIRRRVDYLEIPLLLRLAVPNRSFFEPHALTGPAFAYRTGAETDLHFTFAESVEPAASRVQMADIFEGAGTIDNPRYRDVDWSLITGGGVALGRGPFRVVVETRYVLGLVGAFETVGRSNAHNRSWITTLGIELR